MKKTTTKASLYISSTVKAALMVAGTTIGAGMLAIPLVTSETGFLPASITTVFVWLYMYITGMLLMEVSTSLKHEGGFLQMAEKFLPAYGKQVIGTLFVFLYGILLVAYISAGSTMFGVNIGDHFLIKYLFPGILLGLLTLRSGRVITAISLLTIPMWVYFILFYVMGAEFIEMKRLTPTAYSKSYLTVPILFGAFGYHNVIPSISKYLNFDRKKLGRAILFGSLIPCVIYLFWQVLILGIVDTSTLEQAREEGIPVTVLLSTATKSYAFAHLGTAFAFFAILTSALGVGLSLVEFIGTKQKIRSSLFVILIPALIAFIQPGIFLRALSFAGGVGESILNGIIPVWMYCVYKMHLGKMNKEIRIFTFVLFLIAAIVVTIELNNCM